MEDPDFWGFNLFKMHFVPGVKLTFLVYKYKITIVYPPPPLSPNSLLTVSTVQITAPSPTLLTLSPAPIPSIFCRSQVSCQSWAIQLNMEPWVRYCCQSWAIQLNMEPWVRYCSHSWASDKLYAKIMQLFLNVSKNLHYAYNAKDGKI